MRSEPSGLWQESVLDELLNISCPRCPVVKAGLAGFPMQRDGQSCLPNTCINSVWLSIDKGVMSGQAMLTTHSCVLRHATKCRPLNVERVQQQACKDAPVYASAPSMANSARTYVTAAAA